MTALCISHLLPVWIIGNRLQGSCVCTVLSLTQLFDVLDINSLFHWISMCYVLASSSQVVLVFCTCVLTLAAVKMSYLLHGLVHSLWAPGSHDEAGRNLVPNWYLFVIFGVLKKITGKLILFSDLLHLLNPFCGSNMVLFLSLGRIFVYVPWKINRIDGNHFASSEGVFEAHTTKYFLSKIYRRSVPFLADVVIWIYSLVMKIWITLSY